MLIWDLNVKSKNWHDHDKSSHEGNAIGNVMAQFGLQQIIKEPTHISNTSSSCIGLTFTSQPNLITDSGVHSSLHPNCHHHIVFPKFNLHIVYDHLIYERSGTSGKQTQDLLDVSSKNFVGKEHFRTQESMKKLMFLMELFSILLVTILHMK